MFEKIEKLDDTPKQFDEMYVKAFGTMPVKEDDENTKVDNASNLLNIENISVFENEEKYEVIPNYKFIGALFNRFSLKFLGIHVAFRQYILFLDAIK